MNIIERVRVWNAKVLAKSGDMATASVAEAERHSNKFGAGAKKRKKLHGQKKVEAVMHEFKHGTLHSGGSKKIVKKRSQAQAIAMSEAGISQKAMVELWDRLEMKYDLAKAHGYDSYDEMMKAKGGAARGDEATEEFAHVPGGRAAKKRNPKAEARAKMRGKVKREQYDKGRDAMKRRTSEELANGSGGANSTMKALPESRHILAFGKGMSPKSALYEQSMRPTGSVAFGAGSLHCYDGKKGHIHVEVLDSSQMGMSQQDHQGMIYVETRPEKIPAKNPWKAFKAGWVKKDKLSPLPQMTKEEKEFAQLLRDNARLQYGGGELDA